MTLPVVEAVACSKCGTLYERKSDGYVAFWGNVTIGEAGGVIGNNFDEAEKLIGATILCKNKPACWEQFLKEVCPSVFPTVRSGSPTSKPDALPEGYGVRSTTPTSTAPF